MSVEFLESPVLGGVWALCGEAELGAGEEELVPLVELVLLGHPGGDIGLGESAPPGEVSSCSILLSGPRLGVAVAAAVEIAKETEGETRSANAG